MGQALLRFQVLHAQQGLRVPGAQDARGYSLLNTGRQAERPDGVRDLRPGPAYLAGQLLVRGRAVFEKLLVGGGLLERVQLLSVQLLDQRVPEHVIVWRLPHDCRDLRQASPLAGPPTLLARGSTRDFSLLASRAGAAAVSLRAIRTSRPTVGSRRGEPSSPRGRRGRRWRHPASRRTQSRIHPVRLGASRTANWN